MKTQTGPNILLLLQVWDIINTFPEQYNQEKWHCFLDYEESPTAVINQQTMCNTAHCFAGWAHVIDNIQKRRPWGHVLNKHKNHWGAEFFTIGKDVLGLTDLEANDLFDAKNTLENIQSILERIIVDAAI